MLPPRVRHAYNMCYTDSRVYIQRMELIRAQLRVE